MACQAQEAAADAGTTEGGVERFRQPSPEDSPGRFRPARVRSACRTVAQLPSIGGYGRSYSCLGGWNLMISDNPQNPTAAWEFIRFAADPDRQKQRALEGGFLPTVTSLYDDAEIAEAVPVVEAGRQAIENARVRPVSPVYSRVSPRIVGPSSACSGAISPARRRSRRSRPSCGPFSAASADQRSASSPSNAPRNRSLSRAPSFGGRTSGCSCSPTLMLQNTGPGARRIAGTAVSSPS